MFSELQQRYLPLACLVVVGMLITINVQAQLEDPTLPPQGSVSKTENNQEKPVGWNLTSILISEQRSIAIINGRSVQVGDTLAGARVQSINDKIVKLRFQSETISLKLYPVAVKAVREE